MGEEADEERASVGMGGGGEFGMKLLLRCRLPEGRKKWLGKKV